MSKIKTITFFSVVLLLISSSLSISFTPPSRKNDSDGVDTDNPLFSICASQVVNHGFPVQINHSDIEAQFKIKPFPLGSAGPIIASLLELWATYTDQYFVQPRQWREFELQRQRIRGGTGEVEIIIVDDEGDGNFTSIQSAIDYGTPGDAILVYSGKYEEHLIINKSLWLIGIDTEFKQGCDDGKPVLESSGWEALYPAIRIIADNVTLAGFEIRSDTSGVNISNFPRSIFVWGNNIIVDSNLSGIWACCNLSVIAQNNISVTIPDGGGIVLDSATNTTVVSNFIRDFGYGIKIIRSGCNLITMNNILDSAKYGIFLCGDPIINNTITKNNFLENAQNAYCKSSPLIYDNIWDWNGSGNYWDDYNGTDVDGDGIGDTPYETSSNGSIIDNYPLMDVFINHPPRKPTINPHEIGILCGKTDEIIPFYVNIGDPDGDQLHYKWLWGDNCSEWYGPYESGTTTEITHIWPSTGENLVTVYHIQIIAIDNMGLSNISDPYEVHLYDLSAIKNSFVRKILDNLLPSYFQSGWN